MASQYFKIPIPKGYRIFFPEMRVSGVSHRKAAVAKAFGEGKEVALAFESEPDNPHDPNAIKVVAFKEGFWGTKKLHIGYVPAEVAATISGLSLTAPLLPRVKEVWVGGEGGMIVAIDILGLKADYDQGL